MNRKWLWVMVCACLVVSMFSGIPLRAKAAATMTSSEAMVDVLKTMEGFSEKPYWDYAQWTVGYGTRCPDDKLDEYRANGITREEAQALLEAALSSFETAVNNFAFQYDLNLKQNQFDALVSFSYNCGTAWMYETTGYFNTAVRLGDMGNAFIYGICLYSTAGGDYILTERRMCEADMYINGAYHASNASGDTFSEDLKWVFLDGNGGKTRYAIYGYHATDPQPISVTFSSIPTGVDGGGEPFAFELEGWYTADGEKVENLDGSLPNGEVIYAQWQDPEGEIGTFPTGKPVEDMTIAVTGDWVNIRSGPGTYYPKLGTVSYGTVLTLQEVVETSSYTWGKTDQGWLSLSYTNYDDVLAEQEQFPKQGTVNATAVNYRTEPVVSSSTWAGQMDKGDRVEIVEAHYDGSMWWGKMSNGYWISLDYVTYDADAVATVTDITLLRLPDQTEYEQMSKSMNLEGSILLVSHSDGTTTARTLTREMVSGFGSEQLGSATVTAAYEGFYVNFQVEIVKPTVTFLNWDKTVLRSQGYAWGETVIPPEVPEREFDGTYYYVFTGWDKPVTACQGTTVYTATFRSYLDPDQPPLPESLSSSVYGISGGWIRQIPVGTTAKTLLQGINEEAYAAVYHDGSAVAKDISVTTGMEVRLLHGSEVKQTLTAVVTGDPSGDGKITVTDMIGVKSHLLGKSTLSGAYAQAADCNGDGGVSITDFIQIKAQILGKSSIAPN